MTQERDQFGTTRQQTSEMPDRSKIKSDATELLDKAKQAGQEHFDSSKRVAAAKVEKVAAVMEQASSQFKENDLETLAQYTSEIGNTIKNLSESFQNRSLDDLISDVKGLAKRNPTAFVLGSIAVGVALARFAKASGERRQSQTDIYAEPVYGSSVGHETAEFVDVNRPTSDF